VGLNDIARVSLRTSSPLFYDSYRRNRITGSVILIDESTNETVAAGSIREQSGKALLRQRLREHLHPEPLCLLRLRYKALNCYVGGCKERGYIVHQLTCHQKSKRKIRIRQRV